MTNIPSKKDSQIQPEVMQDALEALVIHQKSSVSMKQILREMRLEAPSEYHAAHESLALGVIRYLNTLDFLIARSLDSAKPQDLAESDRNLLRLMLYITRWLGKRDSVRYLEDIRPELADVLKRASNYELDPVIHQLPRLNQFSILYSHPTFIVETLLKHLGEKDTLQLLLANNKSRIQYLRPNRHRKDFKSAVHAIQKLGVDLKPDSSYPDLYRIINGNEVIPASDLFRSGDVLIQDKASVLTAIALHATPGETVWDACAAPGMKTQLITEMMKNSGRVVASDIYSDRVRSAKDRFDLLGVNNTSWVRADASKMKVNGAQKILIDAPCTSTGILQGHPSFKWRLNKNVLMAIMSVQHKILDGILTAYKDQPGTEVVYATCSILPHEGESQIDSVMNTHDIELIDTQVDGDPGYRGFQCSKMVRRLFPHRHETSGFFISRMRIMQ
jgi:16S rRNA (cytosine967-C5)-methyltransferase